MNIVNDLKSSKNGLQNLKETYNNDIKFMCDIDVLIQIIDAKLLEMNDNLLPPPPISTEENEET